MRMDKTKCSFIDKRRGISSTSASKKNDVSKNRNIRTNSIPSNRDRNLSTAKYQRAGSERRTSETRHSNRNQSVRTAPSYLQNDIAKDEVQAIYKLFDALAVFKRTNIPEIKQVLQLLKIIMAGKELSSPRSEISRLKKHVDLMYEESKSLKEELRTKDKQLIKLKQGRDWNVEHEQLKMRHHDLQRNYDKMKYECQVMLKDKTNLENEIETLLSKLMETEQEFFQQQCDICMLQKYVESVEKEASSLKTRLHENHMQILKQNQGSNWNVEHERVELRHKDMQRKSEKVKDESKAIVMEKFKLENEIKTLRSTLKRSENELLDKTSEMSKLKKQVQLMDKESKLLKAQLQEKDKQLLNKKQGKYWNVDQEQLEKMGNDFQGKLDKINGECQEMVMAKAKLEKEVDIIRSKLRNTEQELSEKTSEISGLKARVKSMEDESKCLKAQLQEQNMLLPKQNPGRNWNWEFEQLNIRYKDLQGKFDKIKDDSRAMEMDKCTLENINEKLRSVLRKTEQELSEQTSEISKLQKRNESMNKESESLKTQLQEKDMMLLKQNEGRNMIGEYEQLELRHKDLQQEFDKIKYESQTMAMDKNKLENENQKLRSMLRKTEQDFSQQRSEMTTLKKHVESVVEKSESLKSQLQEKERQQMKQNQGRNLNVEYEQLVMRHNDLQRKFDKIDDEARALMVDKTNTENENEKLRAELRKTEQESLEQKNEISRLKKRVENMIGEYEQLELRHKDIQQEFDKIKYESQTMAMDKNKLENENQKLRSMLRKTEQDFSQQRSEMTTLKKHVESVVEKSESLKSQLQEKERQQLKQNQGRNLNVEYEQLVMRHNDLQRKFDKIEDEARALMVDKTKIENENKKLSAVFRKTEQESLEQRNEISILKKRVENMDREFESLKAHLQQKESQLQEQILATTKAYAEKDDALTRLSRLMGQQMSEGNPNITDLSDQNRPSKLGERYSELYDNEWTNAFEVLTGEIFKDDKEAIEVLRTILLESYMRALDFSISQMKEAEYKLSGSTKGVGPECKRLLKEARKHIDIKEADSLLENVLEVTLSKVVDRRYIRETTLRVFAKECFLLCWFMSIQDPPVVLVENPTKGSRFDTNIYKHYMNSGDTVDYVVWPALLLHKGGPLLTKGVAQPFVRPGSD